ncbi:MAG: hypothetical protein H6512_06235 [Acidimicrobiia bacterium]|nr:hypothetical protein [Acidimicrobiia bacterium]
MYIEIAEGPGTERVLQRTTRDAVLDDVDQPADLAGGCKRRGVLCTNGRTDRFDNPTKLSGRELGAETLESVAGPSADRCPPVAARPR